MKTSKSLNRLFIDPASRSSGWAHFHGDRLVKSGTIAATSKDVFIRLGIISFAYTDLEQATQLDEVHIEQFGGRPHRYLQWSVGAIGAVFADGICSVAQDVPVSAWQKYVDWKGDRKILKNILVDSEDELAAIGMGYWYLLGRKE